MLLDRAVRVIHAVAWRVHLALTVSAEHDRLEIIRLRRENRELHDKANCQEAELALLVNLIKPFKRHAASRRDRWMEKRRMCSTVYGNTELTYGDWRKLLRVRCYCTECRARATTPEQVVAAVTSLT